MYLIEITTWLRGLERMLERTLTTKLAPEERTHLEHRRGVYSGVADDIERLWNASTTTPTEATRTCEHGRVGCLIKHDGDSACFDGVKRKPDTERATTPTIEVPATEEERMLWKRGQFYGLIRAGAEATISGAKDLGEMLMRAARVDLHDAPYPQEVLLVRRAPQTNDVPVAPRTLAEKSAQSLAEYDRRAEVEGRIAQAARIQTRERCAQELYDLARWCRDHGFAARASFTESAARRLQGIDDDGKVINERRVDKASVANEPEDMSTAIGRPKRINYRCTRCGVHEQSGELPSSPALRVYPLPPGWKLIVCASCEEDDHLHCSVCVDDEKKTHPGGHNLACDVLNVDPAIGRATKPCNCPRDAAPFMTVIVREGAAEALPWANEAAAKKYFVPAQAQWSEAFLCRVIAGPRALAGFRAAKEGE
jgi:hypothetical protein